MKRPLLLVLLIAPFIAFAQNINSKFSNFDRTGMETSILYNNSGISNIVDYTNIEHTKFSFLQAYKAISFSDFEQRLVDFNVMSPTIAQKKLDDKISLAILISEFETIKPEVENLNIITKDPNGNILRLETETSIFNKHELAIIAPLQNVYKGLNAKFELPSSFLFNTTEKLIISISGNFDNGLGFVPLNSDTVIEIKYDEPGLKNLQFQIQFSDGSRISTRANIKIEYSNSDVNLLFNRTITTFTSTNTAAPNLAPYGESNYKGVGEYDIFLSADEILDKPIFLVDGFDPGDTRNILSIYELLDFDDGNGPENLGDMLRAEGFDIVILNFPLYVRTEDAEIIDGGADFIERNAMLLVELIGIINASNVEQNVIIGPSMGGLISRYALNYMENQNLTHNTRLWISFDAPHLGANVPIGFQHMFNYLAYGLDTWIGDFSVEALKPVVDGMLKSPAARQMLTDQFETHLLGNDIAEFDNTMTLPEPHPFYNSFFSSLNALTTTGYPEETRSISMINGSGIGNPYFDKNDMPMLPGRKVLDAYIPNVAFLTDAYLDSWYTPSASGNNKISDIWIDAPLLCFCDINTEAFSTSFSFSDGVDTASGGLFDISELAVDFAGTDPLIDAFLSAMQTNYFNFIPSVSGMALENDGEINWYHNFDLGNPNSRTVQNETPFVNWYMPIENENHITLTQENVDFAIGEIMPETLSAINFDSNTIKIKENPVSNNITILSNTFYENASITITDSSGKIVFDEVLNIESRTSIPFKMTSGLYILNIASIKKTLFKTKIIKY
jgi:hypothetical protein